jgi:aspartyl-tRNA(Asn)/glutamyl-tRNA(Gln) amidotransferase subunit C
MVDKETIKKVAELSRLNLTEKEIESMQRDFEEILASFEILKECPTVEEDICTHPLDEKNNYREDELAMPISQEEALKDTPNIDGYFKGPKAI